MRTIVALLSLLFAACTTGNTLVESTGGVRLYTRAAGSGPPVVVVHGGPGMDHASLAADLEPLLRSHRLIFYDQRGGGRSTLPADASSVTIGDHVADLEALRSHYGLEKLTILAHSFGPAIAALYAIEHPTRVERMIFLGPIPPARGTFFEDYGRTLSERLTPEERQTGESLVQRMVDGNDAVGACREYWKIQTVPRLAKGTSPSVVRSDLCTASPEAIRYGMAVTNPATFASLGEWDWRPQLAKVSAPVLIIHGVEDAIPLEQVRDWARALPAGRMMELEGSGHFPHAEKPEAVFEAIRKFLRE